MTDQKRRAVDIANTRAGSVRPELEARQERYRRDVDHLAVVSDSGVVGLVSAVDLLHGIAARHSENAVAVGSSCPVPGPRIEATEDVGVAARRMFGARAEAAPAMRGGEARDVLTAVDLVRSIADDPVQEEGDHEQAHGRAGDLRG